MIDETALRQRAEAFGQDHLFRFWSQLDTPAREHLLEQIDAIDFPLMSRLTDQWIFHPPAQEVFKEIRPVPVIPLGDARESEAWDAGEDALRAGRVAVFLVAGGQGTRLGYDGPKGAYPIGPITGKSLFAYHAEKIQRLQARYECTIPWYIMVSAANHEATEACFKRHGYFGLHPRDIRFIQQRMVPCVDHHGKFVLDAPGRLATNPNGHGGCIPAIVENGLLDDARNRGIDILSYFQVDNWAAKLADPRFIGYHVMRRAQMSSKNHRKNHPREAVGVHCLCDGEYRVIEYSELDIYPQLLETDPAGDVVYYAGNPALHILSVDFIQNLYNAFDQFPWHLAHKRIPYLNEAGDLVKPDKPNGYKFETFVFDALRFIQHPPVALEIVRDGEYTPIKQFEGDNSVAAARRSMNRHWGKWMEAVGADVPRNAGGEPACFLEISPRFALTQEEFIAKSAGRAWRIQGDTAIGPDGDLEPAFQQ